MFQITLSPRTFVATVVNGTVAVAVSSLPTVPVDGPTTLTGDVTGTGTGTVGTTLATVEGVSGTYSNLNATIDDKGRVIEAANGTGGGGPVYNTRAQLQNAINAAVAGGVVTIANHIQVDGPVFVPIGATGITLDGAGTGWLSPLFPYNGVVLSLGPPLATAIDGSHRPASLLDVSASSGRTGVATLGTHSLTMASDCITLGCAGGGVPTYYVVDALTVDVALAHPVTLSANAGLLGMNDGSLPDPWGFFMADSSTMGFAFQLTTGIQIIEFAYNQALTLNDVSVQIDFVAGVVIAFLNGTRVVNTTFTAGTRLRPQSGLSPFGIGYTTNFAPSGGSPVTNITVHGLRITAEKRYNNASTQALIAGGTLNSNARYFAAATGNMIGYLKLDDTPAAPTAAVEYGTGQGIAYWCPTSRPGGFCIDTVIKNLKITGNNMAAAIQTGDSQVMRIEDSQAFDGTVGIGSMATSATENYTIEIANCRLGGKDSAWTFQNVIFNRSGVTNIVGGNKTTGRESGCYSQAEGLFFWPNLGAYTRTVFEIHGGIFRDDSGHQIDDENGVPSTFVAVAEYTQGNGSPGSFCLKRIDRSIGVHPYVRLVAISSSFGSGWAKPMVDVSDLTCFNGFGFTGGVIAVEFVGPDVFRGTADLRGINVDSGAVSGTSAVAVLT